MCTIFVGGKETGNILVYLIEINECVYAKAPQKNRQNEQERRLSAQHPFRTSEMMGQIVVVLVVQHAEYGVEQSCSRCVGML